MRRAAPYPAPARGVGGSPLWRDRLEQAERRWALQTALLEAFKPKDAGGQVLGAGLEGLMGLATGRTGDGGQGPAGGRTRRKDQVGEEGCQAGQTLT